MTNEEILGENEYCNVIHCNVKVNAEIIARILDCDVVGEEYFCIEPDGTLIVDLPIETEKVKRVDLLNSEAHIGSLYYADNEEDKKIPKKPMHGHSCPCCDTFCFKNKDKFCHNCGQAIDWSEENDGDFEETSVCDSCELDDPWECHFCCDKCHEDYGECPDDDCNPMDI